MNIKQLIDWLDSMPTKATLVARNSDLEGANRELKQELEALKDEYDRVMRALEDLGKEKGDLAYTLYSIRMRALHECNMISDSIGLQRESYSSTPRVQ